MNVRLLTKLARTVVALTLVLLPLRPMYGDSHGLSHAAADHGLAGAMQNSPDMHHVHADADRSAACVHETCCSGSWCDGDCLSCAQGAVLVSPVVMHVAGKPVWNTGAPAASIEIVLPTQSRPPKLFLG